jgi:hypothetical protein
MRGSWAAGTCPEPGSGDHLDPTVLNGSYDPRRTQRWVQVILLLYYVLLPVAWTTCARTILFYSIVLESLSIGIVPGPVPCAAPTAAAAVALLHQREYVICLTLGGAVHT